MANDRNIAAGPPKGPRRVVYGQKGLKTGVPKDMQRRNLYGGAGGGRPQPTQPPMTDQFPNPNVPTTPPNHPGTPIVPGMPPNGWQYLPGQGPQGGGPNNYDTGWNGGMGMAGGAVGGVTGPLPKLSPKLRAMLKEYGQNYNGPDDDRWYASGGDAGGGIPVAAMRRLMRTAKAQGLRGDELSAFLNRSFIRGFDDPNGGGGLARYAAKNYNADQLRSLSEFAAGMNPRSGIEMYGGTMSPGSQGTRNQAALLNQFPDLWEAYARQAGMSDEAIAKHAQGVAEGRSLTGIGPGAPTGDVPLLSGGGGSAPTGPGAVNTGGMPDGTGGPTYAGSTQLGSASNLGQVTNGTNQPLSMSSLANGQGGGGNNGQGYLPPTANYEAGNRGLEDQLSSTLASLGVAREQIPAEVNRIVARLNTDQTYATQGLYDDLGQRGLTMDGVGGYLGTRDVAIPFGREYQDTALQAAQQYAQLAQQEGEAYLGYNQGDMENLLARAAEIIQQMPLSLQQSRNAQTQRRKPKKGKKGKGGRGRG